jgi:hypothetical protein
MASILSRGEKGFHGQAGAKIGELYRLRKYSVAPNPRATPQSVALVVKRLIGKAGIPVDYPGHSLLAVLAIAVVPDAPSWPRGARAGTSERDEPMTQPNRIERPAEA